MPVKTLTEHPFGIVEMHTAQQIEADAQALMEKEKAEAAERSANNEWGKEGTSTANSSATA